MPIPGYDEDDLDEMLEERLEERDEQFLTPSQREEYENGGSLLDILSEDDIHRLLN
ncbi:hypothetical protein ACFFQF_13425 [Haladaptatus pallidirubidus]|uniref:DUF8027 domain-containing protein n=1 Tax=Haladaptatus pallidirubidus TaxID=1008152 RepID=A0AAV3UD79_9EURY|nr:hypothetical protein [Haladaptatus pallidirubidus]